MECFGMPVFKDYTREELKQIKIEAPEEQMRKKVQKNWDHVAKPLDGPFKKGSTDLLRR